MIMLCGFNMPGLHFSSRGVKSRWLQGV
jgi:hypothetical protein